MRPDAGLWRNGAPSSRSCQDDFQLKPSNATHFNGCHGLRSRAASEFRLSFRDVNVTLQKSRMIDILDVWKYRMLP